MLNSIEKPKAWAFYVEQARNIMNEPTLNHLGNYRIPKPDKSGEFIYADDPKSLWIKFEKVWKDSHLSSKEIYDEIQYIVTNFAH